MGITKEDIRDLRDRVKQLGESCKSVDSIKTGLVLPFLQKIGWDVFSPTEVIPQYVGIGQKEPIDFAIKRNGEILYVIKCVTDTGSRLRSCRGVINKYIKGEGIGLGIVTNGVQWLLSNGEVSKVNLMIDLSKVEDTLELVQLLSKSDYTVKEIESYFKDNTDRVYIQQFKESIMSNPPVELLSILYATFQTALPEVKISKEKFKQLWSKGGAVTEEVLRAEDERASREQKQRVESTGIMETVILPAVKQEEHKEKGVQSVRDLVKEIDKAVVTPEAPIQEPEGEKAKKREMPKKRSRRSQEDTNTPIVIDNTLWRKEVVTNVAIPQTLECDLMMEQFGGNVTYYTKEGKFILHKGATLKKAVEGAEEYRKLYPVPKYAPDYILSKDITFRSATDVVAYMAGRRVQGYTWLRIKHTEVSLDSYLRDKAIELGYIETV